MFQLWPDLRAGRSVREGWPNRTRHLFSYRAGGSRMRLRSAAYAVARSILRHRKVATFRWTEMPRTGSRMFVRDSSLEGAESSFGVPRRIGLFAGTRTGLKSLRKG